MKLLLKISLLILAMFVVNVNPINAIIVLQKLMQIKISFRKEMTKYIYKVIENGSTNIVGMEMI